LVQIKPNNGFETGTVKNGVRSQDIYPRPPRLIYTPCLRRWGNVLCTSANVPHVVETNFVTHTCTHTHTHTLTWLFSLCPSVYLSFFLPPSVFSCGSLSPPAPPSLYVYVNDIRRGCGYMSSAALVLGPGASGLALFFLSFCTNWGSFCRNMWFFVRRFMAHGNR